MLQNVSPPPTSSQTIDLGTAENSVFKFFSMYKKKVRKQKTLLKSGNPFSKIPEGRILSESFVRTKDDQSPDETNSLSNCLIAQSVMRTSQISWISSSLPTSVLGGGLLNLIMTINSMKIIAEKLAFGEIIF